MMFQSTHPHGVRLAKQRHCYNSCHSFNPRTHTGCDTETVCIYLRSPRFQSTHPHGVRPACSQLSMFVPLFQSTHPHGVRPGLTDADGRCGRVSIHAPTRGATRWNREPWICSNVSIHAPTRGATACFVHSMLMLGFQSTHPHGVRRIQGTSSTTYPSFNPRTHTGCDPLSLNPIMSSYKFQSTHPHGVRPSGGWITAVAHGFNPRTHTGCDRRVVQIALLAQVSIHAPTRGATFVRIEVHLAVRVSIHAPTRGATRPTKSV